MEEHILTAREREAFAAVRREQEKLNLAIQNRFLGLVMGVLAAHDIGGDKWVLSEDGTKLIEVKDVVAQ